MKITVLDGGIINPGDLQWEPITGIAETDIYADTSPEQIAERTADADVVIVNRLALPAEAVAALGPNVKLVAVMATDAGPLCLPALDRRSILVCNVRAYSAEDVAQHTLALMLEMYRRIGLHSTSVHDGEWTRRGTWCYWLSTPRSLDKKVLGLVGFGSIGRRVGRLANAFGMEVLACCRTPRNPPSYSPFSFVPLDTLLQRADIVSLHCPFTPQTREIINARTLARMKEGACLINVSHGGLVCEEDCLEAMNSGRLGGVATDVLREEPPSDRDPFLCDPRVLITPHMAWSSRMSRQRLVALTAENIRRWMQGTPVNLLNKVKKSQ
ncbi:MAG: D-2-hydroxyacid dehydrogenase [Desulfovibrionaceae bacterium]|nr:D-2-hydroxyacid dehydrogenase [Desulfovibrionaceae bacterium]